VIGALGIIPICGWILASVLGLIFVPVGFWLMLVASHLYAEIGQPAGIEARLA
jgi:hypothetical protein